MRFRLWDINNEKYCKDYSEIAERISFVTASEGSKFAIFTVNMPEFVVEFDTECMDKFHEPIFGNDRVRYEDEEYSVVFEDGVYVLYAEGSDQADYTLSEVAAECEIIGTVHDAQDIISEQDENITAIKEGE